jgi:HK97 family phage major capsid protein
MSRQGIDKNLGTSWSGSRGTTLLDSDGKEVRCYAPGEKIEYAHTENFSLGKVLQAAITRRGEGLTVEERAAVGDLSSGGYTVPSNFGREIIQSARNASVIGAVADFIDMPNGNISLVGVSGEPTATWVAENADFTESNVSFFRIDLKQRKLGTYIVSSVELAADGSNFITQVQDSLRYAVQNALEQATFEGSGTGAVPLGMANDPNVLSTTAGAAVTLNDLLKNGYHACRKANGPEAYYIVWAAGAARYYDLVTLAAANPYALSGLFAPASWKNITPLTTNALAYSAANVTNIYTVNKGNIVVGYDPSNIMLEIFRSGTAGAHSAVSQGKVIIRIYLMADIAMKQPSIAHCYKLVDCT